MGKLGRQKVSELKNHFQGDTKDLQAVKQNVELLKQKLLLVS